MYQALTETESEKRPKKIRRYRRQDTGIQQVYYYPRPPQAAGEDRISYLPAEIQTYILRFLPTKVAFKTSLLSRQWRKPCCSLSKLAFNQSRIEKSGKFKCTEVIDQSLSSHDESYIEFLSIEVKLDDAPVTSYHLDDWVSTAVSHHAQTFILSDTSKTVSDISESTIMYTLPTSLISCGSIKVLQVIGVHLNFPSSTVCIPNLKFLTLLHSRFTDAVFFTSNTPMLNNLVIRNCLFDTLSISSSTLEYLEISHSIYHPKIDLNIPNLTYFDYHNRDPPNVCLETLSSLNFARFAVMPQYYSRNRDLVRKIFKGLLHVRKLVLFPFYIDCLADGGGCGLLNYPAAPWASVKVLSLSYSSMSEIPLLKLLLRSYPNLEVLELVFDERRMDDNDISKYWEDKGKEMLPDRHNLNRLTTVHFMHFGLKDTEFELMKFVLEKAAGLTTMQIGIPEEEKLSGEYVQTIYKKLKLYSQKRRFPLDFKIIFAFGEHIRFESNSPQKPPTDEIIV